MKIQLNSYPNGPYLDINGPTFEEGGAMVRCYENGTFELFEIPQYGGMECSYGFYNSVQAAFAVAQKWC